MKQIDQNVNFHQFLISVSVQTDPASVLVSVSEFFPLHWNRPEDAYDQATLDKNSLSIHLSAYSLTPIAFHWDEWLSSLRLKDSLFPSTMTSPWLVDRATPHTTAYALWLRWLSTKTTGSLLAETSFFSLTPRSSVPIDKDFSLTDWPSCSTYDSLLIPLTAYALTPIACHLWRE